MYLHTTITTQVGQREILIPRIERFTTAANQAVRDALAREGIETEDAKVTDKGLVFRVTNGEQHCTEEACQRALRENVFFAFVFTEDNGPGNQYLDNLPGAAKRNGKAGRGDIMISTQELNGMLKAEPRPADLWCLTGNGEAYLHATANEYGSDVMGAVEGVVGLDGAEEIVRNLPDPGGCRDDDELLARFHEDVQRATTGLPAERRERILAAAKR